MTDQEIVALIKNGKHSQALEKLYKIYPAVQKYALECACSITDAEDMFQDGLVIFIEKTERQDFKLTASISTYLFGICKNLCREKQRNFSRKTMKENELEHDELSTDIDELLEEERKYKALDKILIESGKKCMDLLKMFYVSNLSLKVIASSLGFKSETSAKTQKYKCLEKARNLTATILMEQKQTTI